MGTYRPRTVRRRTRWPVGRPARSTRPKARRSSCGTRTRTTWRRSDGGVSFGGRKRGDKKKKQRTDDDAGVVWPSADDAQLLLCRRRGAFPNHNNNNKISARGGGVGGVGGRARAFGVTRALRTQTPPPRRIDKKSAPTTPATVAALRRAILFSNIVLYPPSTWTKKTNGRKN